MSTNQLCARVMFECDDADVAATLLFKLHDKDYTYGVHALGRFVYATMYGTVAGALDLMGDFMTQSEQRIAIVSVTPDKADWDCYSLNLLEDFEATGVRKSLRHSALVHLLNEFRTHSDLEKASDETIQVYISYTSLGSRTELQPGIYRNLLRSIHEQESAEDAAKYMEEMSIQVSRSFYTNLLRCIICATAIQSMQ